MNEQQQQQLKEEVAKGRFKSLKQAQAFIKTSFGLGYSLSGVRKLLHRLGCSFHKASSFLFKADRAKQQEFVDQYNQDKESIHKPIQIQGQGEATLQSQGEATPQGQSEATRQAESQGEVKVENWRRYFMDGVHPIYGMEVLFYCWLLIGQRFEVGVGGGRKRLNILGAFSPDDHEYLDKRYTDKNLNAQSVIDLFELMMQKHPETKRFTIYLDNARYQHAKILKEWVEKTERESGVKFELKYLPGYSPNLNLIERLWKFMRKKALQSWHESFEKMQEAVGEILDNLSDYKEELDSLMADNFRLVPEMSSGTA